MARDNIGKSWLGKRLLQCYKSSEVNVNILDRPLIEQSAVESDYACWLEDLPFVPF